MSRIQTLALGLALATSPLAVAKPVSAVDRTEAFIAALLKVRPDDGKLNPKDKEFNQKAFVELDSFFDFERLTAEPIAPRADKFTAAQRAEFNQKFKDVLRLIAYPDSGAFFKRAKYTVGKAKEEGELVTVPIQAKVVKDDLETMVALRWRKAGDTFRIDDVAFDGDSLVKDYRNQFVRIIDKEGVKGLLDRIDKRRSELDKPSKSK